MTQFEIVNPASALVLSTFELAGASDVEAAVAGARRAFDVWQHVAIRDKARILHRISALICERGEDLALLETRNVGKPIRDSRDEVSMSAEVFDYYAGAIDKHLGDTIPVDGAWT